MIKKFTVSVTRATFQVLVSRLVQNWCWDAAASAECLHAGSFSLTPATFGVHFISLPEMRDRRKVVTEPECWTVLCVLTGIPRTAPHS